MAFSSPSLPLHWPVSGSLEGKKVRTRSTAVLLSACLLAVILFTHLWRIADLPAGLFQDESAIGLNAALIAETGYDEHQHFLPVYFESFGDYKAPVYVYAVAAVFRIVGVSDVALRMTSALFFTLFFASFTLLTKRLFGTNRPLTLYVFIVAGTLPWFFVLSRIAFEVISQLAVVTAALLFVHRTFVSRHVKWHDPVLAGLLLGLSLYTYPTARLLTPLLLVTIALFFFRRSTLKQSIVLSISAAIAFVPYLAYGIAHPGAMTARFRGITYLFDASLSIVEKVELFLTNYAAYFTPTFLLFQGDPNLRHATSYGGELFFGVLVLAVIGFVFVCRHWKHTSKFSLLIATNAVLAPVAAALTSEGTPHSLRSILLGLWLLLLSCYGLHHLLRRANPSLRRGIAVGVLVLVSLESAFFLHDYFGRYAEETPGFFHSSGFRELLLASRNAHPEAIVVSRTINYSFLAFYKHALPASSIPIEVADPIPEAGTCLLYLPSDDQIVEASPLLWRSLSLPGSITRARCYPGSREKVIEL